MFRWRRVDSLTAGEARKVLVTADTSNRREVITVYCDTNPKFEISNKLTVFQTTLDTEFLEA